MSNLLEIEWFILPGAPTIFIQDFCDLAVTVMI
jgi:hypothetical protein